MEEKDAFTEYLKIPGDARDAERLAMLSAIAEKFPDTPTGKKASGEAEALRDKITREREAEAARLDAIRMLRDGAESFIAEALAAGRFGESIAYINRLGARENLAGAAEITEYRASAMGRVKAEAEARCRALLDEAAAQVGRREFGAARETLEKGRELFKMPVEDPGAEGKAYLEEIASRIAKGLAEAARAERDYYLSLYHADRDALFKALDPDLIRDLVLNCRFDEAYAPFRELLPMLKTGAYLEHAKRLRAGIESAARLKERLVAVVEKEEQIEDAIFVPDGRPDETGAIAGLTDTRDGIKILVTQGSRSRLSNVPFSRFAAGKEFVLLVDGRFPMKGEDYLGLAEAALHLDIARCAEHLEPLERAVGAYDPSAGWTPELRTAARVEPLLVEAGPQVKRLVQEAEAADDALAGRSAALLDRLAEEEAAVESFYAAAAPFMKDSPETDFEEAEVLLNDFARNYSNTIFFWYLLDLMGGTSRPDSHLVEFSR
jgi:hypothetical protein